MSQQQLFWTAILAVAGLVGWLAVRLIISHRRLRAHQAACTRPGYAPRETYTGTMKHLSGLPVPFGLKLGVAANRGWGIAFAKERFRYAVPAGEIEDIIFLGRRDIPRRSLSFWPQCFAAVRIGQGEPLIFSLPWPGRFVRRLKRTFPGPAEEPAGR